jgi:hypothetical protein
VEAAEGVGPAVRCPHGPHHSRGERCSANGLHQAWNAASRYLLKVGPLRQGLPSDRKEHLSEQLAALIVERNDARVGFIKARFHRDAAAAYYDSVVTESATITQPAWDSFSAKQSEMDIAGDHLYLASTAINDHVLSNI